MNHENDDFQDGTESSGQSGRFVNIAPKTHPLRGKLIERVDSEGEGAIKRTYENKKGESITVFEKPYSSITGSIRALYVRERDVDWGRGPEKSYSAILILDMKGERVSLEVSQNSRHWAPFCMALPNLDIAKKVRIETYDYDQKGTGVRKAGLTFRQMAIGAIPKGAEVDAKTNQYQVPWYWTKENPGKLPAAVCETNRRGETTWYFDERDAYLRDVVIPALGDRIAKANGRDVSAAQPAPVAQAAPKAEPKAAAQPSLDDEMDDMPPPNPFTGDMGDDEDTLPF